MEWWPIAVPGAAPPCPGARSVEASDGDASSRGDNSDGVIEDIALLGLQLRIDALKPYAVADPLDPIRLQFEYLRRRVAFAEVNGGGSNRLGARKAGLDVVNGVDFNRAAEESRIGSEQAYGASAIYRHAISWLEAGLGDRDPCRGKDVGAGQIIKLVLYALWNGEEDRVAVQYSHIFGCRYIG